MKKDKSLLCLVWGANQLLKERSSLPYVKIEFPFDKTYLNELKEEYELPASITLSILSSHAIKIGLKGWEYFTGIPATLGGAIFMNAGTNLGEIGSLIKSFRVISKDGVIREVVKDENTFSYRKNNEIFDGDVIVSAKLIHNGVDKKISDNILEYLKKRNNTQPLKENTCGCIFKNLKGDREYRAGQLIDLLGLKGFKHKNIRISPKHANFMENMGDGTYSEVVEFIDIIKKELKLQFGVDFEVEVKL